MSCYSITKPHAITLFIRLFARLSFVYYLKHQNILLCVQGPSEIQRSKETVRQSERGERGGFGQKCSGPSQQTARGGRGHQHPQRHTQVFPSHRPGLCSAGETLTNFCVSKDVCAIFAINCTFSQ